MKFKKGIFIKVASVLFIICSFDKVILSTQTTNQIHSTTTMTSQILCQHPEKTPSHPSISINSSETNITKKASFWPQPQFVTEGSTLLTLSESFKVNYNINCKENKPELEKFIENALQSSFYFAPALGQHLPASFQSPGDPANKTSQASSEILNVLDINIHSSNTNLEPGIDESYQISVEKESSQGLWKAQISCANVFGALRAIQTFLQVIFYRESLQPLEKNSNSTWTRHLINAPIHIKDHPRFPHRGLMLDTSRHFFSVDFIIRILDAMSYNKLNVFHWHLVDNQSFPLEIADFPQLSALGSYSKMETYSRSDVLKIVQHAYYKGIRVVPEIDIPGHCNSWAKAFPEIVCFHHVTDWTKYGYVPPCGHLNPVCEKTYQVLEGIVKDLASLFPDPYLHIGFDEIIKSAWLDDPTVQTYLKNLEPPIPSSEPELQFKALLEKFSKNVSSILKKYNKKPTAWSDVIEEHNLTDFDTHNTVLQIWKDSRTLNSVIDKGFQTICSFESHWYLDVGLGRWYTGEAVTQTNPTGVYSEPHSANGRRFINWQEMYFLDPTKGLSQDQQARVLGGEAALWTEMVDENGAENVIWPRTCAVAERLWSSSSQIMNEPTPLRLSKQINRMAQRGCRVSQFWPKWCEQNTG